ncbi:MAG: VOC family protein [Acidimicrobiia bacterium]|nr:VOC family protein [Acidimicrobiia bacterium]NNC75538.1 VOC family protein [Acidimicrobiia bacterium]
MAGTVRHITFDSHDAARTAEFWAAALGFEVLGEPSEAFAVVGGSAMPEGHPILMFSRVPEGKTVKNRVHLDVEIEGSVQDEVARLEALGATRLEGKDEWNHQWTIMADPEGNEFCVSGPPQR